MDTDLLTDEQLKDCSFSLNEDEALPDLRLFDVDVEVIDEEEEDDDNNNEVVLTEEVSTKIIVMDTNSLDRFGKEHIFYGSDSSGSFTIDEIER